MQFGIIDKMEEIGVFNGRKLLYLRHSPDINWVKEFPNKNWLLVAAIDGKNKNDLFEISEKALDHDVCYVCCFGPQGELLHDIFDEEIVIRKVFAGDHHLPPYDLIMTTWHGDLEEILWFGLFVANIDPEIIGTVFCLDACETPIRSELEEIIKDYV